MKNNDLFWARLLVESFIGRLRDECLNEHLFITLGESRSLIEDWRRDYNTTRPHSLLGGLSPSIYTGLRRIPRPAELELFHGPAPQALTAAL